MCGVEKGRGDTETERKKEILSVSYFVVPGFDMSISTLVEMHLFRISF